MTPGSAGGPVLGVDPGSTSGAAVLRDGDRVLAWWTWEWLRGKGGRFRVMSVVDGDDTERERRSVAEVARLVAPHVLGAPLVLEGLYVDPRHRGKAVSSVKMAESAGALLALLGPAVARPPMSRWVPAVLGHIPLSMATATAVDRARRLDWPGGYPGGALTDVELGALSEAAMLAAFPVEPAP